MFDHIQGELAGKSPTQAVVVTGGVGYRFTIPVSTFDALPENGSVKLLTYLYVREDTLKLFGFATEDERKLFTNLLSVQGIGPGTAIAVLNGISVAEFRRAVATEDLATLARAKGIGRKTAQRIVVELKREMERQLAELPAGAIGASGVTSDAVAAMLGLQAPQGDGGLA